MNCCSNSGNSAVGGIKSISMWTLYHHHYYYYCKSGLGCCVQRERRVRYVSGDGPYFYFTWKSGLMAFHLFCFIAADKQKPLKTSSCYDQSLWPLPGLSPLSWCGSSGVQAACSQTTGLSSALFVRFSRSPVDLEIVIDVLNCLLMWQRL